MRIILKIIAAPCVAVLTIMIAMMTFLFCYAVAALNVVSAIGVLLGVVTLIAGQTTNGIILLVLAFLLSPFGLPAVAGWLLEKLDDFNFTLKNFITSW